MDNRTYIQLFAGRYILIVEDDYFLTDETRNHLEKATAAVVGPVRDLQQALKLIETLPVDGAILDIHLRDETAFPVAEELEKKDIPFVFATGYDPGCISDRFTGFALCANPSELERIALALFASELTAKLH